MSPLILKIEDRWFILNYGFVRVGDCTRNELQTVSLIQKIIEIMEDAADKKYI